MIALGDIAQYAWRRARGNRGTTVVDGVRHLSKDERFAALISRVGPPRLDIQRQRGPYEALIRAIAHQQLHGRAAEAILARDACWEVVTPARMAIVTFRFTAPALAAGALERVNLGIVDGLRADGFAVVTSTRLAERTALRLCTINPRTTEDDLAETIARMARIGRELAAVETTGA